MRILTVFSLTFVAVFQAACAPEDVSTSQAAFAFTHVTVIDMTGAPARADMTVIVRGNRIESVGPSDSVRMPGHTQQLNAAGKFLIPGLWDMHVHAAWAETLPTFAPLFLANGVTGVREMWGRLDLVAGARIRLAQQRLTEPRMVASGALLDGSPSFWSPGSIELTTVAQAAPVVDSLHDAGADFIKVYGGIRREILEAVVTAAERLDLDVVGHVPNDVGALEASGMGLRSNEHLMDILLSCSSSEAALRADLLRGVKDHPRDSTFFVEWRQTEQLLDTYSQDKCEALAARLARDGSWQVPTLTVLRSAWFLTDTLDHRLQFILPEIRDSWSFGRTPLFKEWAADRELAERSFSRHLQVVGLLHRAGVPILAGTDVLNPFCFPGFSLHDELALLVEAGLTPMQALQTATLNPAIFLNATDSLGTVETGKLADLVLLDADPLADIHNTTRISAVVLNGQLLDAPARHRLLDLVRAAASFPPRQR
jgi:imidazolonepropionase-like amidohydrolase